jgi:tRNA (guanine37-N1)-methyltransferase
MKIEIVSLFPEYFRQSLAESLLGRALKKQLFEIEIVQLRDFATDRHRTVDDTPFGGGGGMVLKVEPLDRCLEALGYGRKGSDRSDREKARIVLTTAAGRTFDQQLSVRFSLLDRLTIVCGHYLGVDERILELYDIDEVSIGDYILTGGEPAAMVIVDAVARLIPGVLGNFESALKDSFMEEILGAPCYTRPSTYRGLEVPSALTSGNHLEIEEFRRRRALEKCVQKRPDLIGKADLSAEEKKLVEDMKKRRDS